MIIINDIKDNGTLRAGDGTWTAWVTVTRITEYGYTRRIGIEATGYSEEHVLDALQCKLKALGSTVNAAYAETEAAFQVKKVADKEAVMAQLNEAIMLALRPSKKESDN